MEWRPDSGSIVIQTLWGKTPAAEYARCIGLVQLVSDDTKPWRATDHTDSNVVRFRYLKDAQQWCERTAKLAGYT